VIGIRGGIAIALAAAWGASLWGAWSAAHQAGRDSVVAQQALEDRVAAEASAAAASAAAAAVAKLRPLHQTILSEVRHETTTVPVYRDCQHPAGQLQRINAAAGHAAARDPDAGGGQLPMATNPAADDGNVRRDDRGPGSGACRLPRVPDVHGDEGAPAVVEGAGHGR